MKKKSIIVQMLSEAVIRREVEYYYSVAEKHHPEAKNWYSEQYHATARYCHEINPSSSVMKWCGVISALSPSTTWQKNKEFAFLLSELTAKKVFCPDTLFQSGIRCLFKLSLQKCLGILALTQDNLLESNILKILNANKTSHFFLNGTYPHSETGCTLDTHMGQIFCPEMKGSAVFTKTSYELANKIFCRIAREKGLFSHELQAMVWCAKVYGNKTIQVV